jgi:hypothetical protein
MMRVMLGREIKILLFAVILFASCENKHEDNEDYLKPVSEAIVGKEVYIKIFSSIGDSVKQWCNNKLGFYKYCGDSKNCFLDSLICFNSDATRLIGVILKQQLLKEGIGDDIDIIYGEKQNGLWYFFTGDTYYILRSAFEQQDIHTPLSYQQLHKEALKSVFGGYVKGKKINEAWFTSHFENVGWGDFTKQDAEHDWYLHGKRYANKKDFFEAMHLNAVRANWSSRDTTKPVIPLPPKNS